MEPWIIAFDALYYDHKIANNKRYKPAINSEFGGIVSIHQPCINHTGSISPVTKPKKKRKHKEILKQSIAPGIAKAISDLCSSFAYSTQIPFLCFDEDPKQKLYHSILSDVIFNSTNVVSKQSGMYHSVPISTVEHENEMLIFNRHDNLPLCMHGISCVASKFIHAPGPLNVYLLPSEEEHFKLSGELPDGELPCLVCIRNSIQSLVLDSKIRNYNNPRKMYTMAPIFQNLVDVPGGYIKSVICTGPIASDYVYSVSIASNTESMVVKHSPESNKWWIDQGMMVYTGINQDHFLQ